MVNEVNGQKAHVRPRAYDASRRRAAAEGTRRLILDIARELFLAKGYGATTVAEIARRAKASPETVYKNFGGKPGLVRAIQEQSLLGAGGPPAEERSDRAQLTETDPRKLMDRLGRFTTEISPLGAPIVLLIRDAAASGHAEMAELLRDVDDARYQRMLHNANQLVGRG
ncbi:MAG TPA: helix-turn-helix domain-containing protein, partial [Sinomonas sp.]|nr:helix-turn-helix domain-containing protein [Sinomonas sp.]